MTDAAPSRAQRFAALVAPAAHRAGYTGHGSNARLARDTGMSESSVSRMLKGQAIPELGFFPALAEKVGVSLLDLLAEMGIPPESLQPLSETGSSQVRSPFISPAEAAERLGLSDPVGREMLIATIERLKRLEEQQDQPEPGNEHGGAAAQM
ncbi:helix-turn-helix domain-containing protein [Streptomyces cyaneofuscatus]|uniref:helix-turn-helix domain-containing protein n=1 Tax=Streptomyces cyaneofuscatus TaxID=66883 RepID=UPI0013DA358D|nr:helix-turn-helix transcriptional regulator [Streptomyces cyaneofuscatus]NDZ63619.1 helix-turn-helix transcriptional regulator [Streptomyces cyaneofuscatus]